MLKNAFKGLCGLILGVNFVGDLKADTVGNAGDPLRLMFAKGKEHASSVAAGFRASLLPSITDPAVTTWLQQNYRSLANDISLTRHVWNEGDQATCARTDRLLASSISLSFSICRSGIVNIVDAGQLLVHESVHHFGIDDEIFADAVAIAVYQAWQRQQPGDQGFRFNPHTRRCENNQGEIGHNPSFSGECGDFMNQDLSNLDLSASAMRAGNLSFTDLFYTNFSFTNLRFADLSFANLQDAKIEGAIFQDADLQHATIVPALVEQDSATYDFKRANMKFATLDSRHIMDNEHTNYHPVESKFYLQDADLSNATFFVGRYVEVDASGARLENMVITCFESRSLIFTNADLTNAHIGRNCHPSFAGAILRGTDLSNLNLNYADFRFSLEPAPAPQPILTGASFNSRTQLPFSEAEALARGMIRASE